MKHSPSLWVMDGLWYLTSWEGITCTALHSWQYTNTYSNHHFNIEKFEKICNMTSLAGVSIIVDQLPTLIVFIKRVLNIIYAKYADDVGLAMLYRFVKFALWIILQNFNFVFWILIRGYSYLHKGSEIFEFEHNYLSFVLNEWLRLDLDSSYCSPSLKR